MGIKNGDQQWGNDEIRGNKWDQKWANETRFCVYLRSSLRTRGIVRVWIQLAIPARHFTISTCLRTVRALKSLLHTYTPAVFVSTPGDPSILLASIRLVRRPLSAGLRRRRSTGSMTRFVVAGGLVSLIPLLLYCPTGGAQASSEGVHGLRAPRKSPEHVCKLFRFPSITFAGLKTMLTCVTNCIADTLLEFHESALDCSVHDRQPRSIFRLQVPSRRNWKSLLRTDCGAPCGLCNSYGQCETCAQGYYAIGVYSPVVICCRPRPPCHHRYFIICSASHIVASQLSLVTNTTNCWPARLQRHVSAPPPACRAKHGASGRGVCCSWFLQLMKQTCGQLGTNLVLHVPEAPIAPPARSALSIAVPKWLLSQRS